MSWSHSTHLNSPAHLSWATMESMRDIDLGRDVVWIPGVGQMIGGSWFDRHLPEDDFQPPAGDDSLAAF